MRINCKYKPQATPFRTLHDAPLADPSTYGRAAAPCEDEVAMRNFFLGAAALVFVSGAAMADTTIDVVLKDHKFSIAEIKVKARASFVISLTNNDQQAEEFDSPALKVEKVVAGKGGHGNIRVRALAPGRYPFVGEFFGAKGAVIAE